ncbi:MAG: RNA 2',3'-cyclic phosphodiesterase [Deltaproteobacteria bacterium]|nr:RNA 2',3'-cyclic phosphodiesterase [Deltaproteobacteria bacterium]
MKRWPGYGITVGLRKMDDKIRTFVAIRLPENVLHAMGKVQDELRKPDFNIRWVRPHGIHLTLKFLGDVHRKDLEPLGMALAKTAEAVSPFTLRGTGVGVFPNARRPRVIWVGLSGEMQDLLELQGRLEAHLESLGHPREKRPFRGHLTLGRIKGRVDTPRLIKYLEALKDFYTDPFVVGSIVLFQSTLRPQGAVYTALAEARLGVPAGDCAKLSRSVALQQQC